MDDHVFSFKITREKYNAITGMEISQEDWEELVENTSNSVLDYLERDICEWISEIEF